MKLSGEVFVQGGVEYVVVKVGSTFTRVRRADTGRRSLVKNSRLAAEYDRAGRQRAKRARTTLAKLDAAKAKKTRTT